MALLSACLAWLVTIATHMTDCLPANGTTVLVSALIACTTTTIILLLLLVRQRRGDSRQAEANKNGAVVDDRRQSADHNSGADEAATAAILHDIYAFDAAEKNDTVAYDCARFHAPESAMLERSQHFLDVMSSRRSVRHFSRRSVPRQVVEKCLRAAGTAPSGAHLQPWTFVVVASTDVKSQIRAILEREEEANYCRRMGRQWVADVHCKLRTSWHKPYLEEAPLLVVVMKQSYGRDSLSGERVTHHYAEISVAIAMGMLVAALHHAGLATVTTTPLNAGAQLRVLLERPENEKVLALLPVGYPAEGCRVPCLERKRLEEIAVFV